MRFLGIDYGTKRIGLAISDENHILAFSKEIILNDKNYLKKLADIIQIEEIGEIVVGESLNFAGQPNLVDQKIKDFVEELKMKFSLPVHLQQEFLTSVEARRYNDQGQADAKAAALILQRYLDRRFRQEEGQKK